MDSSESKVLKDLSKNFVGSTKNMRSNQNIAEEYMEQIVQNCKIIVGNHEKMFDGFTMNMEKADSMKDAMAKLLHH